ncbi:MAG: hypothetical protein A2014_08970 [Spirochaetes bacterium GWF1_49_6]|nr:MAG: hypothetical protein A2014_08970 [Spirochaetes bacterium GWF1_49_6]
MKKWAGCLVLIFALAGNSLFADTVKFTGFEFAYGPYDIMGAPSFELFDIDGLVVKPYLRFDPFVTALQWGIHGEFFPGQFFHFDVPLIGDFGLNDFYAFTGFRFPIDFSSMAFPAGIGLQIPLAQEFFIGFRVYANMVVAPVGSASISWDFSFEYKTF